MPRGEGDGGTGPPLVQAVRVGRGPTTMEDSKPIKKLSKSQAAFYVHRVLVIPTNVSDKILLAAGLPAPTDTSPTQVFP